MIGELRITDEARSLLGCEGISLESGFVTLGDTELPADELARLRDDPDSWLAAAVDTTLVLVSRVDRLDGFSPSPTPQRVVKFSERRHAMPQAENLNLGTPRYYRGHEQAPAGIGDAMEASQTEDMVNFIARQLGAGHADRLPPLEGELDDPRLGKATYKLSGQVTHRTDGFWLFCTSAMPKDASGVDGLRRRFGAECATAISDPPEFARKLGRTLAENLANVDLELDWVAEMQMQAMKHYGRPPLAQRVLVHHGPVVYMDDAAETIFALPLQFQAVAAAFIKRRAYEWQQEYRFTVSAVGCPADDNLLLPISSSMRDLVEPEPV